MATIKLVRVDTRLIHGQVIAKWRKQTNADHIMVIDDALSKDPFMSKVYTMAAPPGTSITIMSSDCAVNAWNKAEITFGRYIVLFKNIESALSAWQKGFPIQELQIGGLGDGPGRKRVFESISLDNDDFMRLTTMAEGGVSIAFQVIPESKTVTFESIKKCFM